MLLAAGLGTRLRPLTDRIPKALIPVGGMPMLERVARRLIEAGADRLIINTHHLAEQIERFVAETDLGVEVRLSREEELLLDTGGGLLHAAPHFRRDAPFFLHNTDILSDLPLGEMYEAHRESGALATLAVSERSTSRHLLFDEEGLCGRTDERKQLVLRARPPVGEPRRLAFGGIHVISPEIFGLLTERGVFSILDPYLRLAGEGHRILPFRHDAYSWQDIGKPEQLAELQGRGSEASECPQLNREEPADVRLRD